MVFVHVKLMEQVEFMLETTKKPEEKKKRTDTDNLAGPNDKTYIISDNAASSMEVIFTRFMAHYTPFGFHPQDREVIFYPLPYKPEPDDKLLLKEPWRLILELYKQNKRMVMGIDLYGDLVLGRGKSQPGRIILPLEDYDAVKLGVSREHALIRATATSLFVIDQGSTNGTKVNGALAGQGMAVALKDNDLMEIGQMTFMVKILSRPKQAKTK